MNSNHQLIQLVKASVLAAPMFAGGSAAMAESQLYKCTDGRSTTYSSTACDKLGLRSAGSIRDRLTIIGVGKPVPTLDAVAGQGGITDAAEARTLKQADPVPEKPQR